MVTQNDIQLASTVIDDEKVLPFQLMIIEGKGKSERKIPVPKLTKSIQNIPQYIYTVEEYKDLKVKLQVEEKVELYIIWGSMEEDEEDEPTFAFVLNEESSLQSLFINRNGHQYHWRCGLYHIELIYNNETYYGGFEVIPKNVDEKQYREIYELINRELEGLAFDFLKRKQTFREMEDFTSSDEWRFIQWFQNNERKIHQSLSLIETNNSNYLQRNYIIENEPKRIDNRSIKWQNTLKGQTYDKMKYLNRTYEYYTDSDSNRLVKYRVSEIINKLKKVINYLAETNEKLDQAIGDMINEISQLEERKRKVEDLPQVIKQDKISLEKELISIKNEKEKLYSLMRRYENYIDDLLLSKKALVNRINSNFWENVKGIMPQRTIVSSNIGYQLFHQLWRDYTNIFFNREGKATILPAFQPSYKLYEYYVLLSVIHIFQDLGFTTSGDTIYEQLKSSFISSGLRSGTYINLERENQSIRIVYDEMVETVAEEALQKGKNFYSGQTSRKPDIRIDYFLDSNEYKSSFVIEVKYSPFYNIHRKEGKTIASKQMTDYWNIMYAQLINGEIDRKHQSIKEVVCVYPGDNYQPIIISDNFGKFLQFYPNRETEDIYDIVGKDELKSLINKWLENDFN